MRIKYEYHDGIELVFTLISDKQAEEIVAHLRQKVPFGDALVTPWRVTSELDGYTHLAPKKLEIRIGIDYERQMDTKNIMADVIDVIRIVIARLFEEKEWREGYMSRCEFVLNSIPPKTEVCFEDFFETVTE